MIRPSRQGIAVLTMLLVAGASLWVMAAKSRQRVVDVGFWFEPVSYQASDLGEAITAVELQTIESLARAELAAAFAGLRITFSDRRDGMYRVRVVDSIRDARMKTHMELAGESRAITGLGGQSNVNFRLLASYAVRYAPPGADRATKIAAIGRGVGRTAAHELAHQLLPKTPLHATTDVESYEYPYAYRREQYFGDMHWDLARPMLQRRLGLAGPSPSHTADLEVTPATSDNPRRNGPAFTHERTR